MELDLLTSIMLFLQSFLAWIRRLIDSLIEKKRITSLESVSPKAVFTLATVTETLASQYFSFFFLLYTYFPTLSFTLSVYKIMWSLIIDLSTGKENLQDTWQKYTEESNE